MKTILEYFLDALDINYTKHFIRTLYQEHPHKYNMFGLKKMLDVYGVRTIGVRIESKDLSSLNYPCILHIHGDFVVGLDCKSDIVRFLQHGKETTLSYDVFRQAWTGNALVVQETTDAIEPEYKEHRRDELMFMAKTYCIPVMLILAVVIGLVSNFGSMGIFEVIRILLSCSGIFVCTMLMEKQLYGESRYGDRVCSLFHHADCNSILDGPMTKVFGVSWSEVGLGYFMANILLLSLFPASSGFIAAVNWIAMLYGIWSVYYQWRVAKSWCVLCMIVQVIIWAMGITAAILWQTEPFVLDITSSLLACIVFVISIMTVHQYASNHVVKEERVRAVQLYRALKTNGVVAKVLFEKSEYYETTLNDSSIIFGNPKAKMCITILGNLHCNPCARMHKRVERLLSMRKDEICVQYIFSSFNKELEDCSRYLISYYFDHSEDEAMYKFALWYTKEKFNYKKDVKEKNAHMHITMVEKEIEKHRLWCEKTSLVATPTVLINGHVLPKEYELEDVAMIISDDITEKNILQDINGRSTTPLGTELLSVEESV